MYKVPSVGGKYILGFNPDLEVPEGASMKDIPFAVNSIVSVAASVLHVMKSSGLIEKYT